MAVYFIAEEGTERVKIGHSQWPWSRLDGIQTTNRKQLIMLRAIEGGRFIEQLAHKTFRSLHLGGEWFRYSDAMWDFGEPIDIGLRYRYRPKKQRPGVENTALTNLKAILAEQASA